MDHSGSVPAERVYYQHSITGDRGYLVHKDDTDYIRSDRPNDPILRKFTREWAPVEVPKAITRYAVARVSYESDRCLRLALGQYSEKRRDWLSLKDEERIEWMEHGPKGELREKLYKAIHDVLLPLAE